MQLDLLAMALSLHNEVHSLFEGGDTESKKTGNIRSEMWEDGPLPNIFFAFLSPSLMLEARCFQNSV